MRSLAVIDTIGFFPFAWWLPTRPTFLFFFGEIGTNVVFFRNRLVGTKHPTWCEHLASPCSSLSLLCEVSGTMLWSCTSLQSSCPSPSLLLGSSWCGWMLFVGDLGPKSIQAGHVINEAKKAHCATVAEKEFPARLFANDWFATIVSKASKFSASHLQIPCNDKCSIGRRRLPSNVLNTEWVGAKHVLTSTAASS